MSLLGAIADSEDAAISGAPEFAIALRTQLLVGAASYAIQEQPEYEAAFGRPGGGGAGEEEAQEMLVGRLVLVPQGVLNPPSNPPLEQGPSTNSINARQQGELLTPCQLLCRGVWLAQGHALKGFQELSSCSCFRADT